MNDLAVPASVLIGMNGFLITLLIALVAYVFKKLDKTVEDLSKAIMSLTERIARLEQ